MTDVETVLLKPGAKPVDAVADYLAEKAVLDDAGVMSLARILLVVPTAQSGRRIRLALARRFPSGLVPPVVRTPAHLVERDSDGEATRTDELVAFWEALGGKGTFDNAAQLADIRAILGAGALSFALPPWASRFISISSLLAKVA